jgi:hypothetical protein
MPRKFLLLLTSTFALASVELGAQRAAPDVFRNLPLHITTRETPAAVQLTDGRYHVSYLLFVTNWLNRDLHLRSIEIGAEGAEPIARFDSAALTNPVLLRSTYYVASSEPSPAGLTLQSGRTALVNVYFTTTTPSLPPRLVHTLRFARDSTLVLRHDDGSISPDLLVKSLPLETRSAPLVISAPVRGGPWRCGNGLAPDNAHAAVYPFRAAQLRVPQRFGCDFFRTDSAGSTLPNPFPDTISNEMFYGYGEAVIAVADGTIAYVKDGIPENVPQANGSFVPAVLMTNETNAGNWVSLRLAPGVYAFYAHLQPGSIRVRTGQRVRRGQVIGLLGNSGNSVGPHLHFHIGNANSLSGSDAVPHVYRSFIWLGTGTPDRTPERRARQLPGPSDIVRFP